jgi:TolB protein
MKQISKFALLILIIAFLYLLNSGNLLSPSLFIIAAQFSAAALSIWSQLGFQAGQFSNHTGPKEGPLVAKGFMVAFAFLAISLACSSTIPFPTADVPVPTPKAPLGLIAYVGNDGNIYTTDRDGKQLNAITQDANLNPAAGQLGRIYQYPTWASDGQHLAFARFSLSQSGQEVSLFSVLSDGKKPVKIYTSQNFQPFYLSWSPNSQIIAFLGSDASGALAQYLVAASGGEIKFISSGQPYYWDWSPDSQTLIVHIGGSNSANPDARLAFIGLDGSTPGQELDLNPGSFEAPAWSSTGDVLALAAQNDAGDDELILAGQDGKVKQVLARLSGPVAFAWSPKGVYLAYAVLDQTESVPTIHLFVLDSTHPELQNQVAQGELVAFFWSPDGQKIAYFILRNRGPSVMSFQTVAQTKQGASLVVRVYDRISGDIKDVATFAPTVSFQQVLPYYSQYQRSETIWSPDSKNLVLSGVDSAGENAIFTVGADGSRFQKIADGDVAFWSWK